MDNLGVPLWLRKPPDVELLMLYPMIVVVTASIDHYIKLYPSFHGWWSIPWYPNHIHTTILRYSGIWLLWLISYHIHWLYPNYIPFKPGYDQWSEARSPASHILAFFQLGTATGGDCSEWRIKIGGFHGESTIISSESVILIENQPI